MKVIDLLNKMIDEEVVKIVPEEKLISECNCNKAGSIFVEKYYNYTVHSIEAFYSSIEGSYIMIECYKRG